jgi:hypothetical protein
MKCVKHPEPLTAGLDAGVPALKSKRGGFLRFAGSCMLLVLARWTLSAAAVTPELDAGVVLMNGSSPLSAGIYTAPCVLDWNNDGKKDLLVGQFYYGYIYLFLNQGSDAAPVFRTPQAVTVSGVPLTTSYG